MMEMLNPFANQEAERPIDLDGGFAYEPMPEGLSDVELLRYEINDPTPEKDAVIDLTTLLVDRQGPELSGDETERIRKMISVGLQEIFESPGLTSEERDVWQTRIAPQAADEMREYSGILAAKDAAELNGYAYEMPDSWATASQDFAEMSGVEPEEVNSIVEAEIVEDNAENNIPEAFDEESTAALGGVATSEVVEQPNDEQFKKIESNLEDSADTNEYEPESANEQEVIAEMEGQFEEVDPDEAWDEALKNEFTESGGENLPEAPQDIVDTAVKPEETNAETIDNESEVDSESTDDKTEEVSATA